MLGAVSGIENGAVSGGASLLLELHLSFDITVSAC
jgi:hypothetical protein